MSDLINNQDIFTECKEFIHRVKQGRNIKILEQQRVHFERLYNTNSSSSNKNNNNQRKEILATQTVNTYGCSHPCNISYH